MEIETQGNFVTSWDYRGALQCFNITDHLGYEYILPRDAAGVGINVRGKCLKYGAHSCHIICYRFYSELIENLSLLLRGLNPGLHLLKSAHQRFFHRLCYLDILIKKHSILEVINGTLHYIQPRKHRIRFSIMCLVMTTLRIALFTSPSMNIIRSRKI